MDHSLRGYLSRQTTEALDLLLHSYLDMELTDLNAEIIRLILAILQEREKDFPALYPPDSPS